MMAGLSFFGNQHVLSCLQERLAQAGFHMEDHVEDADVVLTCCTTMTELEDLYFGEAGLLQKMREDALVVDMSATTPNFAHEINSVCVLSGFKVCIAPMVVKDKMAGDALTASNMRTFCFGEDGALEAARPLLEAIYGEMEEVASPGAAQLARSAIALQDSSEIVAAAEVYALFKNVTSSMSVVDAGGLKPQSCAPQSMFAFRAMEERRFNGSYTVEMMMSELSSVMMTADDHELILPQLEAAFHMLELLCVIGGADKSPAAICLVFGSDQDGEAYGLDWSRADSLYSEASSDDEEPYDEDDYADEDEYLDDIFGRSSGFSTN
ncbi:MAG: NAD(P)-dependent oxidoreductase [Eggerthellaceae bacterium]|nr:NAD(P)-dependent oxidoreductase [Eggerthellaceae bacterium]